ncbi:MAG TPA: PEP-CTERM sorting domain-containing protein [Candidatus Limnocylindrales bacterium]|nr:PEP-CTERM sorting domain-containing protein [Candidatus Limnocylindrales bacterium]
MKTVSFVSSIIVALTVAGLPAEAATYLGTGNSNGSGAADGAGISSVVVNNDATSITFTINSSQAQASYIFYSIELQIVGQAANGDTSMVNPWGEHVGISTGENALINTWGTGATPGTFSGGVWTMGSGASYVAGGTGSTFATMTVPLSSLNLSVGNSFYFDVVSSYAAPGGQSAYGALDNTSWPAESDASYQPWLGSNYYDSATDAGGTIFGTAATLYTVVGVPEPATCALLGLGSLFLIMRRRISSAR